MRPKFPPYKTAKVASLIPYASNARTHTDEQVAQIAASIKEFGFLAPIVVDGDSGIVAGHGRILAAEMTGRVCHAIELSPQYVDVAVRRWEAFTGKEATNEATGRTFKETEAERHGDAVAQAV